MIKSLQPGVRCRHIHSSRRKEYEQHRYLFNNTDIYSRFVGVNTAYVYWLLTPPRGRQNKVIYRRYVQYKGCCYLVLCQFCR